MRRMYRLGLVMFVLVMTNEHIECANKYSKEANQPKARENKSSPFRMQTLNVVWQKAIQKLDEARLKNLYNDLKRQDKEEINLKRIKADNQDEDGLVEGETRRRFKMILSKYKLDINDLRPINLNNETLEESKKIFKDQKLNKLWSKALSADFSEHQLKALKEEIREFEDKLEQFYNLADIVHEREHKLETQAEASENHIEILLENDRVELEQLKAKLKEKQLEFKDEYRRLENFVLNLASGKHHSKEFEEAEVSALWTLALQTDFTAEELETIRDDLQRFQVKLKKHEYFKAELEKDRLAGKKESYDGNQLGNDQDLSHTKRIKSKMGEIGSNIEKMKRSIEERIMRRHTEL